VTSYLHCPRVAAPMLHSIYVGLYSRMCGIMVFIDGMEIYPTVGDPDLMSLHHKMSCRGFVMPEFEKYENVDWNLVSSVKASERRTQVLQALNNKPMMNSELADDLNISTAWVRRQMKWLEDHDLVEDLTKSKHNYKLYGVTEEGEEVVEVL